MAFPSGEGPPSAALESPTRSTKKPRQPQPPGLTTSYRYALRRNPRPEPRPNVIGGPHLDGFAMRMDRALEGLEGEDDFEAEAGARDRGGALADRRGEVLQLQRQRL